jgi:bifunctional UDP-N-acetylglucosamine pyrophosphorylase/glucosamine-1-phosphate N-acetyltransferase
MKAVILAAGGGRRMRPLTDTRPKVMLPLVNKPIIEHLLMEIKKAGIEEFIFVVGYGADAVRDYFGSGEKWGVNIDYVNQRKQLGSGHAAKLVEGLAGAKFLLTNGDILVKAEDLKSLISRDSITLSVIQVAETESLGVVETKGKKVVRLYEKVEKPPSNLANAGVYLLTSDIFQAISITPESPRGEYEIVDSLQLLIDSGHAVSYQEIDYWLHLDYPWNLLEANESLMEESQLQNSGTVEENVIIRGAVSIGKGTVVKANSYLSGPLAIGENCQIGPQCYIRPYTAIGDNCHIGSAVEIKNSIIMMDTNIPHHNYVGDSVIAAGCNLGAGTKIANLRLDKNDIKVGGINTKRRKLGVIMGDGVQTGINVSIDVGSLIGSYTFIGPGATVKGTILPNSRVF